MSTFACNSLHRQGKYARIDRQFAGQNVRALPPILAMKQTLQLRLGQHLTMTPQLQQAIRLLQLSALELRTEVQEALESNLMLELSDDTDTDSTPAAEVNGQSASQEQSLDLQKAEIPEELPVDSAWEDIYDNVPGTGFSQGDGSVRDYEPNGQTGESLREHLRWQMQLTTFSDTDVAIAETIIDSINDDGYLSASLEDMHESLTGDIEVGLDEFEAVLHQIQNFDPPGVAARDLRESLLLQLRLVDVGSRQVLRDRQNRQGE